MWIKEVVGSLVVLKNVFCFFKGVCGLGGLGWGGGGGEGCFFFGWWC